MQKLLDETLKSQGDAGTSKRSRADADDPAMGELAKVAEQGKQAKAEVDKLVDKANQQAIYGRIDACLTEYDTLVQSVASTMAWFNAGRKKVRKMVAAQATHSEVSQGKAARVAKKKADKEVFVPETSEDEDEQGSESESEESEEHPPPGGNVCGAFQRLCLKEVS